MIGASAALSLSGVPFNGPIGGARVGFIDGQHVLNPTVDELKISKIRLSGCRYCGCGTDG